MTQLARCLLYAHVMPQEKENNEETTPKEETKTPKTEEKDENVVSKASLQAERQLRKDAEKREAELIKKYGSIDPERYSALLQADAEREQKELEAAREWETLKQNAQSERDKAVEQVRTEFSGKLTSAEKKLNQIIIENALTAAGAAAGVFPKALKRFAKDAAEYIALDDEYNPTFKDGLADDIDGLVEFLKEQDDFGIFFAADIPAGSNTPQNRQANASGGAARVTKNSELKNDAERAAYGRTYGFSSRKDPKVPCLLELTD